MKSEINFVRQFIRHHILPGIILSLLVTTGNIVLNGQTESIAIEAKNENYRIGPGDVIDVVVSKQAVLSRTGIRISNQGMIQMPMLEQDIPAMCQTEKELSTLIAEKYKKYLLNPNVIVAVKEFNSTPVSLIGSVNTPTRFQIQRPTRLMEVLTLGNGPTEKAGPTIQIIRFNSNRCYQNVTGSEDPKEELLTFYLSETLEGKDQSNPYVQPGDVIRIAEAEVKVEKIGQAYIIGNVKAAKTIDLKDPVTLTQALAMAGGTSEGAQIDKILISRRAVGSLNKTDILVNLKNIKNRKESDIFLQENDIIDVPGPTGTRKFLRDIIKTVVPAVTRFPIPME
jgi:polysaccharide biosynthesis/export protein